MSMIKEYSQGLVKEGVLPQEPSNYDAETLKIYIDHLETENAALRERLGKAVKDVAERIENALFCEFADDMTFKMASRIEEVIKAELDGGKE